MSEMNAVVTKEEEQEESMEGLQNGDDGSTVSPEDKKASTSTASPRRRKRTNRKRKAVVDTADDDNERERLKQRFPTDRRQRRQEAADRVGPLLRKSAVSDRMLVHNPSAHERLVARAEETQANKIVAGSIKPAHGIEHEGPWRCALCQQQSGRDGLGDLFGPYYTRINDDHWPPFVKKPAKRKSKSAPDEYVDLWLHGDCALWAPTLHVSGAALTGLEDSLGTHWAQTCAICSKEGATILCNGSWLHFPCATNKGYKLDRSIFSCTPSVGQPGHRAEKKKKMSV